MNMTKHGGPAFPHTYTVGHDPAASYDEGAKIDYPGMTLRDWFAGQALSGLLSQNEQSGKSSTAQWCYQMAEAMLAERVRQ